MALSLSTAVKNKVAQLIRSNTYANVSTDVAALIDGEGASALTHLETMAQYYTFTSGSGAAPDEWEPWFISEIAWRCVANTHPDREPMYLKRRNTLMRESLASYSPAALSVSPSSSEAFVHNTLNNRKFVISHTAKMNPPLFPSPHAVDAAQDDVHTFIWNKAQWLGRRRPVRMKITRSAFSGGTYTHTTKTISGLTSVNTSLPTGTRFYVTGGTGATLRDFVIASTTSTTIVLDTSLGSGADGSTDIAGFYYIVTFEGMQASESFDSIASGKFFYTDEPESPLIWLDSTQFALALARDDDDSTAPSGRPEYFRTHAPTQGTTTFLFCPPPDDDYELRGEIVTVQPTDPSSTTDTTGFVKFAAEFGPTMRRLQLDKVLTNHGRHDPNLHRQVMDEVEALFSEYQDAGDPARRPFVKDMYGDVYELTDGDMTLGGGI